MVARAIVTTAPATAVAHTPALATASALAATTPGQTVYPADSGKNLVSEIDASTNKVVGTLPGGNALGIGPLPQGLYPTPDGIRVYVLNASNISAIDADTGTVVHVIPLSIEKSEANVFFSPDGAEAYVSSSTGTSYEVDTSTYAVSTITDTASNTVTATITLGSGSPYDVAVNAAGTDAYVGSGTNPTAIAISTP
jgi:YVTN family beta-propeller protein